jgi:hypothetical protein
MLKPSTFVDRITDNIRQKLKITEFVNISKPSTFVDRSFLFCESTELSLLSKDENNKTNLSECFWEKIPELLVIGHKSMPFPVQNPGFD